MNNFEFHRPGSVDDAVTAIKGAEEGKYLAGGQSLIPVMKLDLAQPSDLVSLAGIAELEGIRRDGNDLVIGARVTHAEVERSADVRQAIPALASMASGIGDAQVRNRGTLGGSIAHNDPAADYPAALVALGATVVTDRRSIAAEDFFTGMFETALEPDELIKEVRFPVPEQAGYVKFPNPASRFAIVGVMVARGGDGVKVAIVGAAPAVFRSADMEQALSADFSPGALDGVGVSSDDLVTDLHASADYRAHLCTVIAKRAVARATE